MEHLDSDLLRTFIAVADTGSVTDGAALIYRSQSATSLQIKRLEDVVERPLFERHGRGVVLTEAGKFLLPIARDVTARLDGALRDLSDNPLKGKLRVGIPEDHGRVKLAQIIADFSRSHSKVELDVTCALSPEFPESLDKGRLDIAVYEVSDASEHEEILYEDPTHWVASPYRDFAALDVLPIAVFDQACWWRDVALASVQASGRSYRVVYSSQSVSGIIAAIEAGIAIGLLGQTSIDNTLKRVGSEFGLAPTPASKLVLGCRNVAHEDASEAMKDAIRSAFRV
ncbi:HTH-type transcriptional regulator YofA [Roseovarius albus]|uniref:HTH-type transcriptional regulator YofA n=1 Tax=Roseovarius albus TaxID=1247867 RepID=A0A1X6Z0G7_9RHOB|nr:LysR substrate-binding domain-containing protein [Roseovarius albus]SLN36767.1 HTH-type transcriptional regulator YofA [Roseovarius albus]